MQFRCFVEALPVSRSRVCSLLVSSAMLALVACAPKNYTELYPYESSVSVDFRSPEEIWKPIDRVPVPRDDRVNRLGALFRKAGCSGENLMKETVTGSRTPTVICRLPGKTDKTIVVSSHHIRQAGGKGIFDAWTSVALLPSLYASIAKQEHEHTYEFIAFAATERKGDASYEYLIKDPDRQDRIVAMLWLDFMGLGQLSAWSERTDPNLFADLVSSGQALAIPVGGMNLHGVKDMHDFSRAFRWFEIPTIYLHSFTVETAGLLIDPDRDSRVENLDRAAYFESYQVLAVYLGYLDRSLDARQL